MASAPTSDTPIAATSTQRHPSRGRARMHSTHHATTNTMITAAVRCSARSSPAWWRANEVGGRRPGRPRHPQGTAKRSTRAGSRARRRAGVGGQGQEEGGDADGQRAEQREVPGDEGVGQPLTPMTSGQEQRVEGLGQEQVGHPLDVGDDPAALGDHLGEHGEVVVEQHEAGHRPGRGAAGAHGHADVGLLEGERVVDAVAGHGHDVAAGLQGVDHGPLLLGRDPAEHAVGLEHVGQVVGVVAASWRASTGWSAPGTPQARATAPTVRRVVARDDLDGHALRGRSRRWCRAPRPAAARRAPPARPARGRSGSSVAGQPVGGRRPPAARAGPGRRSRATRRRHGGVGRRRTA